MKKLELTNIVFFCPRCGWEGKENECNYKEWVYCKTHKIKVDGVVKDETGTEKVFCYFGKHIPKETELEISRERSVWCPKCGYDWGLMPSLAKPMDSYSCEGTVLNIGFGMITERFCFRFDGKGMHWENKDGSPDDTMAHIIPVHSPLVTQMRLKQGDKFKVTFERLNKVQSSHLPAKQDKFERIKNVKKRK